MGIDCWHLGIVIPLFAIAMALPYGFGCYYHYKFMERWRNHKPPAPPELEE